MCMYNIMNMYNSEIYLMYVVHLSSSSYYEVFLHEQRNVLSQCMGRLK